MIIFYKVPSVFKKLNYLNNLLKTCNRDDTTSTFKLKNRFHTKTIILNKLINNTNVQ